jgi:antitoxin FitA-like protein
MPTLHVKNIPRDLYEALRDRARANRSSISAEVLSLLKENMPTAKELVRRQALLKRVLRIRSRRPLSSGLFPAAEELLRKDRLR